MLRGALAAAVTPLSDEGASVDEGAFGPYVDFLVAGGVDGLLVLGTTGEGILLDASERMRALDLFVEAARGRIPVAAHCGAQTTAATTKLAAHAASAGAAAVAVIGPPYYLLDDRAQLVHLAAAAAACAPVPFYVYEFARVAGYPFGTEVLHRLRDRASNFAGLKVSDRPWESFRPYLIDGLDVLAGPEGLIHLALRHGAVGAVSGLASAYPAEVAAVVRNPTEEGARRLAELRAGLERLPFHAALKHVLQRKGAGVRPDVRAPLRGLTEDERADLDGWLDGR